MAIVNDIKGLVSSSRLFMPTDVAAKNSAPGPRKDKGKGRRKERKGLDAKIGQGGTLDPLADGVLGEFALSSSANDLCHDDIKSSASGKERRSWANSWTV